MLFHQKFPQPHKYSLSVHFPLARFNLCSNRNIDGNLLCLKTFLWTCRWISLLELKVLWFSFFWIVRPIFQLTMFIFVRTSQFVIFVDLSLFLLRAWISFNIFLKLFNFIIKSKILYIWNIFNYRHFST